MNKELTPAERERLTLIAEEAGEVVQAVTKVLRHGYYDYNPFDENKVPNKEKLEKEIGDLVGVIQFALENADLSGAEISRHSSIKMLNAAKYLHHNEVGLREDEGLPRLSTIHDAPVLPCPYCTEEKALAVHYDKYVDFSGAVTDRVGAQIMCLMCGLHGPSGVTYTNNKEAVYTAIESWNDLASECK